MTWISFIKRNAWAFYFGCAITALGFPVVTWQFWIVVIPVILLDHISRVEEDKKE